MFCRSIPSKTIRIDYRVTLQGKSWDKLNKSNGGTERIYIIHVINVNLIHEISSYSIFK